ncbi:MAG: aspartate/glutamate racemase family protein [Thermodesulfobacteriota bacterium]|nr:aspartate/glutamate racemase family protein [Thermodesulfobacteriota bacterium]
MKIYVINPNTSENMTIHIREELIRIKRPDTELTVVCAERGPETIESSYDETYAIPPTLELVKKANQEGYDAVIIACFSDPGLEAAKEISNIPVIGIGESSFHMAAMLGAKFSIMTTQKERIPSKKEHVYRKGLEHFLASVRSLDLSVRETDANPEKTKSRVLEEAKKAVEGDGAEVIILGCAGMAGFAREIESKLNVKVLDPTAVALKLAEAMADLGLVHSKIGLFSIPCKKPFK